MSNNVSPIPAVAVGGPAIGQQSPSAPGDGAAPTPVSDPGQPAAPNPADLRLVIEDDKAAGLFVYKTVDWRTGAVVQQLPREQVVRMREAQSYAAGQVFKTRV